MNREVHVPFCERLLGRFRRSTHLTAIPELLTLLDMTGCLISIDAMGCQTDIAAQIVDHGGDYLLAVKGNQETLHRAVREAMAPLAREGSHQATIEQSRGRTELREYHVMPAGEIVKQFPTWKGLNTLGVAIGYRRDSKGNESLEYRYYISSAALTEELRIPAIPDTDTVLIRTVFSFCFLCSYFYFNCPVCSSFLIDSPLNSIR